MYRVLIAVMFLLVIGGFVSAQNTAPVVFVAKETDEDPLVVYIQSLESRIALLEAQLDATNRRLTSSIVLSCQSVQMIMRAYSVPEDEVPSVADCYEYVTGVAESTETEGEAGY